jgi:uncharacterized SAM-binding protein YcdF (DUF218 family)
MPVLSNRRLTIVVVLGSPNDDQGRLHTVAVERCRLAAQLARDNPTAKLLLTGGFGPHFNTTTSPHTIYLKQKLLTLGVEETRFVPDAHSRNTIEDASLSKPIVLAHHGGLLVVVTSDYHVARARFLFERQYADTDIKLVFVSCETDEAHCDLELAPLKAHEKRALERLMGGTND